MKTLLFGLAQGADPMSAAKIRKERDAISDVVLAYRPKPKSKPGKKCKQMAKRLAKLAGLPLSAQRHRIPYEF